jgi:predicted metal-dependent enzyme (double-stranded beta helix superfamily)
MTGGTHVPTGPAVHEDEYLVDSRTLREFIAEITPVIRHASSAGEAVTRLRPTFSRLLRDRHWLPDAFCAPCESGGMGGGIGQWLVYRSADRSLTLFSLVVPSGSATPVHDHLAWGLVGLYDGAQEESIYRLVDGRGGDEGKVERVEVRQLQAGDFYELIPPDNDIHSVRTTSPGASVSLHLLASDIGCVWRHAYDPDHGTVRPFRSGYTNGKCEDDAAPTP